MKYFLFLCVLVFGIQNCTFGADPIEKGLKSSISKYREAIRRSQDRLIKAYDKAISRYTKKGVLDKAIEVKELKIEFLREINRLKESVVLGEEPETTIKITTVTGRDKHAGGGGLLVYIYINSIKETQFILNNPTKNNRSIGAIDEFEFITKYPLAKIKHIMLRVEGADAWKMQSIIFQFVQDDKKTRKYEFKSNQWFSGSRADIKRGAISSKAFLLRPRFAK